MARLVHFLSFFRFIKRIIILELDVTKQLCKKA
jgi:hypothetical protein